ncbi:MAG: glycosyltransferase family 4 protein [Catalinimonas sp.]
MQIDPARLRTAVVHEWFVNYAGSERVVEQLLHLYPASDLFALVDFLSPAERGYLMHKAVRTSFIQHLPLARRRFRNYLPLFPMAVEQFDLRDYDVVLSSSHAVAKGALTGSEQLHICYCHSPMRYVWDLYPQYLRQTGLHRGVRGLAAQRVLHGVRRWDYLSANRPDHYVANSHYIARRIRKHYGRPADVVYPPVDVARFPLHTKKEDFYFTSSRMVPYKQNDLIVAAFARMPDKRLIMAGDGPELAKIRRRATPNVELRPYLPADELRDLMQRARAFLFAAEEDFGITLVEAQACGTPVIAFGRGGAGETVRDGETGVLFAEQTPAAMAAAVRRFEGLDFEPYAVHEHAQSFGQERFRREMKQLVADKIEQFNALRS